MKDDRMEIVIKIPKDAYEALKVFVGTCWDTDPIHKAVAEGRVLPKGHGRLIDGDAFVKVIKELQSEWNVYGGDYECGRHRSYDSMLYAFDNGNLTIIEADKEVDE